MLAYVDRTMRRSYGNSVADTNGWRGANWGDGDYQRVYPFISYFEVLARYGAGADASALELIKREWGFMVARGPGTMWETIADESGGQVDRTPSWDHGWSSGAAPALTSYVLGVQPTSPGFATFSVMPHPSGLTSARGTVPTPRGPLRVSWQIIRGKLELQVTAPPGTVWDNPAPQPTGALGAAEADDDADAGTTTGRPLAKVKLASSVAKVTSQVGPNLRAAVRTATGW